MDQCGEAEDRWRDSCWADSRPVTGREQRLVLGVGRDESGAVRRDEAVNAPGPDSKRRAMELVWLNWQHSCF